MTRPTRPVPAGLQRCKISVYTAASALGLFENAFHFELEEKKSIDFAWACLSDPRFTDHLLFKTVLLHQGVILKNSFYCIYYEPLGTET